MDNETEVNIERAICEATTKDWKQFFEWLRQQQYSKINSAPSIDVLLNIQKTVNACHLIESMFIRVSQDKKHLTKP